MLILFPVMYSVCRYQRAHIVVGRTHQLGSSQACGLFQFSLQQKNPPRVGKPRTTENST